MSPHEALLAAIRISGSQAALARICGKQQGHVSHWLKSGRGLPAEYCPAVEESTGVLCEQLQHRVKWEVLLKRGANKAKANAEVTHG